MAQFINDAELLAGLSANLKISTDKLMLAGWGPILGPSNTSAYNEILGALAERGYTAAQISAWDRGAEFEKDIGCFWCLVNGAGLHGNDPTFIDKLDRRKELLTVPILNAGVLVLPGGTAAGIVGSGNLDTLTSARPWGPDLTTRDQFTRDSSW